MRVLDTLATQKALSSDVYSVMQLHAANEPLLPNLTTLDLWVVKGPLIQFLPLFLSTTITSISLGSLASHHPKPVVAAVIANLPKSCPNLQDIDILFLPRDPMITAATSEMLLTTNRNALRRFNVDSPLTEEAREAIYKSQNLRTLSLVIEKGTPIASVSLPNLISLRIECEDGSDGLQPLRRATFGKLELVHVRLKPRPADDFFEAFKEAALSSSIQNTLSRIHLFTERSWNPNYSSLLPFTRLVGLEIRSPCDDSCSGVDDGVIIALSQAMPELQFLRLGDEPCDQFTGGVTVKGLVALAHNCPNLSSLRVHFQVASLTDPPTGLEAADSAGYSTSWMGCALTRLEVGKMPVPKESVSMVALTLIQIFPRIGTIKSMCGAWFQVDDMIRRSRRIVDCSSRYHYPAVPGNSSLTLLRSQSYDR